MRRRGPSACSGKWREKGGLGSRYGEARRVREGQGLQQLGPGTASLYLRWGAARRGPAGSEMKLEPRGWVGLGLSWTPSGRGATGGLDEPAGPPKELSLPGPGEWFSSSSSSSFIQSFGAGRGRGEGLRGLSLPHFPVKRGRLLSFEVSGPRGKSRWVPL